MYGCQAYFPWGGGKIKYIFEEEEYRNTALSFVRIFQSKFDKIEGK